MIRLVRRYPLASYFAIAYGIPHGRTWPFFFLAFVLALTALRVLISWIYSNSGSLFLAQLMHASSTGSLVVFGATLVTPTQEATWYAMYALLLGLAAFAIVRTVRIR